ncbi:MAG: hypothetical protein JJT94_03155 [Bernardetiaceae bacterium]|nr:hypothetical protein [Bernardetiaceae bacterium]
MPHSFIHKAPSTQSSLLLRVLSFCLSVVALVAFEGGHYGLWQIDSLDVSLSGQGFEQANTSSQDENSDKKEDSTPQKNYSQDRSFQGFVKINIKSLDLTDWCLPELSPAFLEATISRLQYADNFYFSASNHFKTLFRCFIVPNAP